jgi:tartrate dehydrogenase/decarboxylase/D-malate dehydrogenase
MLLDHLGEHEAAAAIEGAIAGVLAEGATRTRDMGGKANTKEMGRAIIDAIAG